MLNIENVIQLVDILFYSDYENVVICDMDEREHYKMSDMSLGELMSYDMGTIDGIVVEEEKIFIKISK